MTSQKFYIVTDGEFDGPAPGQNSMMSFASVAMTPGGEQIDTFEATLAPLPDAAPHPETMAFWQTEPEAYAAATLDPQPPQQVIKHFAAWVRGLNGPAIFVSHPLALDGLWFDFYLRRFTDDRLIEAPWKPQRLFHDALCLVSFAAGRLGWDPFTMISRKPYPPEWLGHVPHAHRAIDDARGYAYFLDYMLNKKD